MSGAIQNQSITAIQNISLDCGFEDRFEDNVSGGIFQCYTKYATLDYHHFMCYWRVQWKNYTNRVTWNSLMVVVVSNRYRCSLGLIDDLPGARLYEWIHGWWLIYSRFRSGGFLMEKQALNYLTLSYLTRVLCFLGCSVLKYYSN